MSRYFKQLGLSWKPIKSKKKNMGAYRMDALRSFLISYNNLLVEYDNNVDNNFEFVYTDESYIYKNHAASKSWIHDTSIVNRSTSKGERLIILHAISPSGPLVERVNNKPIDDLSWNKDTPHSKSRLDGKLTCELLWKAQSSSGDYHDNMNSEMFMKWVTEKLVPTFERLHNNKKMVLICDNAAYHHKREIGTLASKTKAELARLCTEHEIEYLDLPITEKRMRYMNEAFGEDHWWQDRGDYVRVDFDEDRTIARATNATVFVPTVEELKLALVSYLKEHKPELLECKVESYLAGRGHKVLWTPPYTPDLQPIELFWAAGKNHAAQKAFTGISMRACKPPVKTGMGASV
jgi:transposase